MIRAVVIATNAVPPFEWLNRLPYAIAIRRIRRLPDIHPRLASVYLRHGMTRPGWKPGLSDIDLTLVVEAGLSDEEAFETVRAIDASMRAIKRRYPMLGEVEILGEPCASNWSRYSLRGLEAAGWQLLSGRQTVESQYARDDLDVARDRLDHACWLYQSQVSKRYYGPEPDSWTGARVFRRVADKTLHYAGANPPAARRAPPRQVSSIMLEVLQGLDRVLCDEGRVDQRLEDDASAVLVKRPCDRPKFDSPAYARAMCESPMAGQFVLTYSGAFLVLEEGALERTAAADVDRFRHACRRLGIAPIIVTQAMFRHFVRSFNPNLCLEMLEFRYVIGDGDPVADVGTPSPGALANALRGQALNVMLAPADVVRDTDLKTTWPVYAWRAAFMMLYLQTGKVGAYHRSEAAARRELPDWCADIDHLSARYPGSPENGNGSEWRRQAHRLLRRFALEIDAVIAEPGKSAPTPSILSGDDEGSAG